MFLLLRAAAGDLVCIPPGYGHVTINPSLDETLTMANLVSTRFESEYTEYERLRGAAYYELVGERLEKNSRYPEIPPVRIVGANQCPRFWEASHASLYDFIGDDAIALLLNYPEKYAGRLGIL
jgi:Thermophilic glucose-6-phosphate isomerase and related metalloenzymes